jgi:hypothetical protein
MMALEFVPHSSSRAVRYGVSGVQIRNPSAGIRKYSTEALFAPAMAPALRHVQIMRFTEMKYLESGLIKNFAQDAVVAWMSAFQAHCR